MGHQHQWSYRTYETAHYRVTVRECACGAREEVSRERIR